MTTIVCDTEIVLATMPSHKELAPENKLVPAFIEASNHLVHSNFYGNIDHIPAKWWEFWK